eukprot:scaffold24983_cov56-Prasinocladus_malaysianus.AAC.1
MVPHARSEGPKDGEQREYTMQDLWDVVNDRVKSKTYCSTDPDFMSRKTKLGLPDVDWGRYNQQAQASHPSGLSSNTVRARVAAGFFELIANWNMLDMVMVQDRCGIDTNASKYLDPSTAMALLGKSDLYGISSRHFTRALQSFEADDFYRYDIIVALDTSVKEDLLATARNESDSVFTSRYYEYFKSKIALLSQFSPWCSDEYLCRTGGNAVLPPQLSELLAPQLAEARTVVDIGRPDLSALESVEQWQVMVYSIILGVAGLLKYLSDACPKDMPHWERFD